MDRNISRVSATAALGLLLFVATPVYAHKDQSAKQETTAKSAKAEEKAAKKTTKNEDKPAPIEPAIVWSDPGDVSQLNLYYGSGGSTDAPDPSDTFTFVSEDMAGTSPKFDVQDEKGRLWRVKLGEEPQSETAASRLMWAAGFFTGEDYFMPELKVTGLPKNLKRGRNLISNGVMKAARLKLHVKGEKDLGAWDWFHNECGPSREYNALRVMMAVINNWDLKTINNKLIEVKGQRECMVSDIGATFGKTGNLLSRSKSDPNGYSHAPLIETVNADNHTVDLVMHSRQPIVNIVDFPGYEERARMEKITKDIPTEDARWLGDRLGMLSESQIRDAFRAAGYTTVQIEEYTKTVEKRIAELKALPVAYESTETSAPSN